MPADSDLADYDAIVHLVATLCAARLIGLPLNEHGAITRPFNAPHLPPEEVARISRQMDVMLFTFRRASSIRYRVAEPDPSEPCWLDSWYLYGAQPHHPEFIIGLTKNGKFDISIRREWRGQLQEVFNSQGLTLGEIALHITIMIYGSPEGHHLIRTEDMPWFWEIHATCAPDYTRYPEPRRTSNLGSTKSLRT